MLVVIETRVDRDVTEMVQEVTKQKKILLHRKKESRFCQKRADLTSTERRIVLGVQKDRRRSTKSDQWN